MKKKLTKTTALALTLVLALSLFILPGATLAHEEEEDQYWITETVYPGTSSASYCVSVYRQYWTTIDGFPYCMSSEVIYLWHVSVPCTQKLGLHNWSCKYGW